MALTACPECGGTISTSATTCPHCGYNLTDVSTVTTTVVHDGYDVMVIDYNKGKLVTAKKLADIIDCTYFEALDILNELPVYLYNDITYGEAVNVAQEMQYVGIRSAIYDPNGTVSYYTPVNYNIILPSIINIPRKPRITHKPIKKHEFVVRRQPINYVPKRTPRSLEMPMNNQPRRENQQPFNPSNKNPRNGTNKPGMPNHGGPSSTNQNRSSSKPNSQQNHSGGPRNNGPRH